MASLKHSASRSAAGIPRMVYRRVLGGCGMPAIGRAGRVPGTRELIITGTPCLIPYRVKGKAVEILRVFHGSRRWPASFND